jgi:hypothetical protein
MLSDRAQAAYDIIETLSTDEAAALDAVLVAEAKAKGKTVFPSFTDVEDLAAAVKAKFRADEKVILAAIMHEVKVIGLPVIYMAAGAMVYAGVRLFM